LFGVGLGQSVLLHPKLSGPAGEVGIHKRQDLGDPLPVFVGAGRDFLGRPLVFLRVLRGNIHHWCLSGSGGASLLVVGYVDKVAAVRAHPLSLLPVCTGPAGVEVAVADDFREFERVCIFAVALLVVAAVPSIGAARVVVVVFHLAVNAAVVVIAGRPVEGCVVIGTGLSYGGQWG